jgi:YVTN family beta-propeller protein
MKHIAFALLLSALSTLLHSQPQLKRIKLPNGWSLTPVGKSLQLGDLPLNMVVSKSAKYVAVTNNGQGTQTLQLFDAKQQKHLHTITIPSSWYGLQFSNNDKYLYASAGNNNMILQYELVNSKLKLIDSIKLGNKWPVRISPTGIAIDDKQNLLYVVTKENNSLYIIDLAGKKILNQYKLDGEAYTCVLSPSTNELYISCWGCDQLLTFDTRNKTFKQPIKIGDNPNEIVVTISGKYVFVCNANDNSVSVIDASKHVVIETLNTALYPDAPSGSTPNGLALSNDEKTLYIANADNNCLSVYDVSQPGNSRSKGFIPTGWYPTSVRVIDNKIWVANGKGFSSLANPNGPNPLNKRQKVALETGSDQPKEVEYIAHLFKATLSIIDEPTQAQLSVYSKAVYNNTPYTKQKETVAEGIANNPIPTKKGQTSPIKHVFYIIKENRTYDQILGDITGGNGDTSLVMFGNKITPNLHALAKEFVLLDNFYVDAEVSADGHNWSTGAYATDYLEKNWPSNYGKRGGDYPGEGKIDIANNKNGFIWNNCKRNGVSYRSYGEFTSGNKANVPELNGHFCPYYTGFNLTIKDTTRFNQWKHDFDSLLARNAVPAFNTVRLGNDHTEGLKKGSFTPYALVADNDLAVGMLVDYISKTSIWKETAIFILEDDAQNGADHVDAHRSTAYVAGGFVKRNVVDHTTYSTSSMLRTMELILGIPPMTQYDAAATPMWRCFDNVANTSPFNYRKSNVNLNERNVAINKWQKLSETFNLTKEDAAPDVEFSEVLWHAVKGDVIPFPAIKRAAFVQVNSKDDD